MTSQREGPVGSRDLLQCYDLRVILRTLLAALVLVGLAFLGRRFPVGSPVRVGVAVSETLVFGYVVVITLMPIRRLDELYQRIHLIAIAAAFGVVAVVGTGVTFLARAGFQAPAPGLWLWPLMVVSWGIGVLVVARRYR
jgi:hypothetical protein